MILIVPSLDPGMHGGIERVSRQVLTILQGGAGSAARDLVLVSNDKKCFTGDGLSHAQETGDGRGRMTSITPFKFYRCRYLAMILHALWMPLGGLEGPILCVHAGLSPIARILAWRLRMPYAVFLHGIEVWRSLPSRTHWGLSGASLLIANSRFTLSKFREWHSDFADKPAEVAHLGLSDAFESLEERKPANFSESGRFVLSVGRLSLEDDYKGHRTLIEAILELRRKCPDVFLVLAGGGNAAEFLSRFAAGQSDPRAVIFTGQVSDAELLWLYRRCTVFAMLSEGEGFGLVHLEAMAQAKPCVGTHADAAAELIEDRVTGRLVPPADAPAVAAALREMLEDPVALRTMGERARQRVSERFLHRHFAERLQNALALLA